MFTLIIDTMSTAGSGPLSTLADSYSSVAQSSSAFKSCWYDMLSIVGKLIGM
ncbi:hypothetical protein [Actinophytocola sp.]|uniref:hypothetical protein n=1 Tax=Actinophytocola sp. TaxID=1872138 RepID=UPI002ED280D3